MIASKSKPPGGFRTNAVVDRVTNLYWALVHDAALKGALALGAIVTVSETCFSAAVRQPRQARG